MYLFLLTVANNLQNIIQEQIHMLSSGTSLLSSASASQVSASVASASSTATSSTVVSSANSMANMAGNSVPTNSVSSSIVSANRPVVSTNTSNYYGGQNTVSLNFFDQIIFSRWVNQFEFSACFLLFGEHYQSLNRGIILKRRWLGNDLKKEKRTKKADSDLVCDSLKIHIVVDSRTLF